jgi:nicotinamidase-related amidase
MKPTLLLIDMQEHFRDGMAALIVDRLNTLVDVCRQLQLPIICTQHGHPDPAAEERSSVLVRWWTAQGSIR